MAEAAVLTAPKPRSGAWRTYFRAHFPAASVLLDDLQARQQRYPAGDGSSAISRSMPAKSRRVRWLSASSSQ